MRVQTRAPRLQPRPRGRTLGVLGLPGPCRPGRRAAGLCLCDSPTSVQGLPEPAPASGLRTRAGALPAGGAGLGESFCLIWKTVDLGSQGKGDPAASPGLGGHPGRGTVAVTTGERHAGVRAATRASILQVFEDRVGSRGGGWRQLGGPQRRWSGGRGGEWGAVGVTPGAAAWRGRAGPAPSGVPKKQVLAAKAQAPPGHVGGCRVPPSAGRRHRLACHVW
ncbi:hypothetical protein J1605_019567 [Eschrichtius robustus]|uniref:Uncharacterized protein n=1 Tax=Eschrichtius robustus TaxID=9764 RepID=A0AB34HMC2_ESCRO|nr:hypothetical protein J1605_019567 [Eschrichtius robustus]